MEVRVTDNARMSLDGEHPLVLPLTNETFAKLR